MLCLAKKRTLQMRLKRLRFLLCGAAAYFIHLNISDNGKGFSHAASAIDAESSKGLGLRGIDERVRILGGTCQIESAPDKGTSINVAIKLSEPEQRTHGN